MKVKPTLLINDILLNDSFQLMIPVYQRNYMWTQEYYGELFDDLYDSFGGKQKNYFLGTFLLKKQKPGANTLQNRCWIIDGQQRVTTIYILIFAILKVFNNEPEIVQWCNKILFNNVPDERKKAKLKLKLIKTDDKVLNSLILDEFSKDVPNETDNENYSNEENDEEHDEYGNESKIGKVFRYFINRLRESFCCDQPRISIFDFLSEVLEKILVVEIDVDNRSENEQLIFDRINATGELLSIVDLIRNFLMSSSKTYEEMKQLYDDKWVPLENMFCFGNKKDELEEFITIYLQAKFYSTQKFAQSKKITYTLFKNWFDQEIEPKFKSVFNEGVLHDREAELKAKKFILDDLNKFAKYYLTILSISPILNNLLNDNLIALFKYLSFLDTRIYLPFLLLLFDDFVNQKIKVEDFQYATYLTLNYLIRLYVCHAEKRELDIIFSSLYLNLKQNLEACANNFKFALNQSIPTDLKYGFPQDSRFSYHLENDELTYDIAKPILLICNCKINPTNDDLKQLNELKIDCIWIFEFNKNSHHFHDMKTIGNLALTLDSSLETSNYERKYEELNKGPFRKIISTLPLPNNLNNDENQFMNVIKERYNFLSPIILKNLPDLIHHPIDDNNNETSNFIHN